ncbi:MAG TPA: hypothetical protein ENI23_07645 [bacterium]|nr:hypothetical protein [bacterium]
MEKKIDEICRMLRDYVKTGNSDISLQKKLSNLFCRISCIKGNHDIDYFIQSLRRELREPEVMNRQANSSSNFLKAK